jgi:hypothetical protein
MWNDGDGTWGLSVDITGDNNFWNIGVAASARGNDNQYEANRGVFAYADGTGTWNIGVDGTTGMSGTANYSGYFHNGDFLVNNTQTPGTGGVLLPPDAIDATEILNEPGITSQETMSAVVFTSLTPVPTMMDLSTVTITIPADGYVVLHANTYVWLAGAGGVNTVAYMQIDETEGGSTTGPYYRTVGCYAKPSAGNMFYAVPLERIYFKTAGTYTFRIEARPTSITGDGEVNFYNRTLMATYVPTSYASVTATVAQDEAAGFEHAERIDESASASGHASPSGAPAAYQVDLRELELKAARTAAEAEKARRELVEAKAGAALRSSQAPDLSGEESHR